MFSKNREDFRVFFHKNTFYKDCSKTSLSASVMTFTLVTVFEKTYRMVNKYRSNLISYANSHKIDENTCIQDLKLSYIDLSLDRN